MAGNSCLLFLVSLLSLLPLFLKSCSSKEIDYEEKHNYIYHKNHQRHYSDEREEPSIKHHHKKRCDHSYSNDTEEDIMKHHRRSLKNNNGDDATDKTRITVSQDGYGDYGSIKEAIASIKRPNTRRVIVVIKPGVYREKVAVHSDLHFVTFLGDPENPPTITGSDRASKQGNDGQSLTTFTSATVIVEADHFVAVNIKFQNTAQHKIGSDHDQAPALRISGTKAAFYNCIFEGSQDTLYDHQGLHYFKDCTIQGSVDFIFGSGTSLYENCLLISKAEKTATITAQKRASSSMSSGFSFNNCRINGTGQMYLGRAWGEYSRVVFANTCMESIIHPQGWNNWGDYSRESKVFYAEYNNRGPGADTSKRVSWSRQLSDAEAQPFIGIQFIQGESWLKDPKSSEL